MNLTKYIGKECIFQFKRNWVVCGNFSKGKGEIDVALEKTNQGTIMVNFPFIKGKLSFDKETENYTITVSNPDIGSVEVLFDKTELFSVSTMVEGPILKIVQ